MKKLSVKHIGTILRVVALIALALIVWGPLTDIVQSRRARVRLLCKTDHRALLESGRELLDEVANGNLDAGIYHLRGRRELPNGVAVPQAIVNLRPRRVDISDGGRMMIEMHGAMDHFGVMIYSEGFSEPFRGFKYGDRRLMDGLWYYDEQYQLDPGYDKVVERRLAKCRDGERASRVRASRVSP